jgi:hypothetical protein
MNLAKIESTLRAYNVKPDRGPWYNVTDADASNPKVRTDVLRIADDKRHPGVLGALGLGLPAAKIPSECASLCPMIAAGLDAHGLTAEQAASFAHGWDGMTPLRTRNAEAFDAGVAMAAKLKG